MVTAASGLYLLPQRLIVPTHTIAYTHTEDIVACATLAAAAAADDDAAVAVSGAMLAFIGRSLP